MRKEIESLVKLAELHDVPLGFNPEIEPTVSPVEAALVRIVEKMSEKAAGKKDWD